MSSKVLLISQHPTDVKFAQCLVAATGFSLVEIGDLDEVEEYSQDTESLAALLINCDRMSEVDRFFARFEGLFPCKKVHAIAANEMRGALDEIVDYSDFGHLILRLAHGSDEEIGDAARHYARVVMAAQETGFVGLAALLPPPIEISRKELSQSLQKRFIVEAVESQLSKRNWAANMATTVAIAVDELLMNAIFDAPVDEHHRQIYETTPRSAAIDLDEKTKVSFEMGFDDSVVAVHVSDRAGSLNRRKVMKHVLKGFTDQQKVSRPSSLQGANLGLALIMKAGGSLCFACDPSHKTEVTAFFRRYDTLPKFKNQFQFISTLFEN